MLTEVNSVFVREPTMTVVSMDEFYSFGKDTRPKCQSLKPLSYAQNPSAARDLFAFETYLFFPLHVIPGLSEDETFPGMNHCRMPQTLGEKTNGKVEKQIG